MVSRLVSGVRWNKRQNLSTYGGKPLAAFDFVSFWCLASYFWLFDFRIFWFSHFLDFWFSLWSAFSPRTARARREDGLRLARDWREISARDWRGIGEVFARDWRGIGEGLARFSRAIDAGLARISRAMSRYVLPFSLATHAQTETKIHLKFNCRDLNCREEENPWPTSGFLQPNICKRPFSSRLIRIRACLQCQRWSGLESGFAIASYLGLDVPGVSLWHRGNLGASMLTIFDFEFKFEFKISEFEFKINKFH